jgi:aryl-alcohol dehydrogenase-like predicted oxidoreductase
MYTRPLGPFSVSAIGLGCMSLSHAYGTPPPPEEGAKVLLKALDLGYTHLDSAMLYGFGANETLLGQVLQHRWHEVVVATKGGMYRDAEGQRHVDGRPEVIAQNCDESLSRLGIETIDLYYLHRRDRNVPIEESVGALAGLVEAGKVKTIGLSEVSAPTIRAAHAVHPITAVQTEYSLWTRNPEVAVLDTCRELGIAVVAFSPLARGFLTGLLRDISHLPPKDIRHNMPRFQAEHLPRNLRLLDGLAAIAREQNCTMGQVALAWVLARGEHIIPIPGTTSLEHLEENAHAVDVHLGEATMAALEALVNSQTVSGPRYSEALQRDIDTEEVPAGPVAHSPGPGAL